ncbi:MAG TPA: nitrile hydratase subunit beta [Bryobacteraceae bacterium]|nr:nitrile hydratase subunit beta [Bryobacteraceae bacterium]
MNGVHDLGGLQDMGPVRHEKGEPVFHAPWEGRIYGIDRSLRLIGKWNLDAWRHQIELLPPADYFRMTYYERWLQINEQLAVKHGLVTQKEIETGAPDPGSAKATPALTAAVAALHLGRDIPSSHDPKVPPQFKVGQRVRARNMNPTGHTRLPRYARGKLGVIARDHGVYLFPDTHAHFQGEKRQHVYSVRFEARELWGANASPRDSVHLDLWDDYLEHA